MGISRRKFIGCLGALALGPAMGIPGTAQGASNKEFAGWPDSQSVLHDITKCIGCRKCESACHRVNHLPDPETSFEDLNVLDQKRRTDADVFTVVNRVDNILPVFVKTQCNHCLEPACASACFVKALKKPLKGRWSIMKNYVWDAGTAWWPVLSIFQPMNIIKRWPPGDQMHHVPSTDFRR